MTKEPKSYSRLKPKPGEMVVIRPPGNRQIPHQEIRGLVALENGVRDIVHALEEHAADVLAKLQNGFSVEGANASFEVRKYGGHYEEVLIGQSPRAMDDPEAAKAVIG